MLLCTGFLQLQCRDFSLQQLLLLPAQAREHGLSGCGSRALECRLSGCGVQASMCLFGFLLFRVLWASWIWMSVSFPREVFSHFSFK